MAFQPSSSDVNILKSTIIETRKITLMQYSYLKSTYLIQILLVPLISFFWSRIQSRITHCIQLLSFGLFQSGPVPQSFFVFHDLDTDQQFYRLSVKLGSSNIFSWLNSDYFGGKNTIDVMFCTRKNITSGGACYSFLINEGGNLAKSPIFLPPIAFQPSVPCQH